MFGKKRPSKAIRRLRLTAAFSLLLGGAALTVAWPDRIAPQEWRRATAGGNGVAAMSFNALLGGKRPSAVLDVIEAAAPDIICLQEMTPELARMFETRLGGRYPYRYFKPGQMTQGVGIASNHPLVDGELLTLGLTYLPAVSATARTKSGAVRVACVHLMPPFARFKKSVNVWRRYLRNEAIRVSQVAELLQHMDGYDMPAVILGDMNEWPGQAAVSMLSEAGFADACEGQGARCASTWPGAVVPFPAVFRIDQILGRGLDFADAAVLEAGGSDHYPVVARITGRSLRPTAIAHQ